MVLLLPALKSQLRGMCALLSRARRGLRAASAFPRLRATLLCTLIECSRRPVLSCPLHCLQPSVQQRGFVVRNSNNRHWHWQETHLTCRSRLCKWHVEVPAIHTPLSTSILVQLPYKCPRWLMLREEAHIVQYFYCNPVLRSAGLLLLDPLIDSCSVRAT